MIKCLNFNLGIFELHKMEQEEILIWIIQHKVSQELKMKSHLIQPIWIWVLFNKWIEDVLRNIEMKKKI